MEFGHFSVRYQPLVCPGECLVRCYKETRRRRRCHGLVPWSFTLAATKRLAAAEDATALCRGVLRLLLQRGSPPQKMPRPCAVEFYACCYKEARRRRRCHGLVPWSPHARCCYKETRCLRRCPWHLLRQKP